VSAEVPPEPPKALIDTTPHPDPRPSLRPPVTNEAALETRRRVERLRRQLEQLGQRLPPKETPATAAPPSETPHPPAADAHTGPAESHPPEESTTEAPADVSPFEAEGPMVQEAHEPPPPEPHPPGPAPEPFAPATKLAPLLKDLPVSAQDRVAVADNLFAGGETILAADIYRQIKLKDLTHDEVTWVEFQMANCDRRLGKRDDARKRYRRLVSDSSIPWVQDVAKWWLDALDQEDALHKEHLRLSDAIQQLKKADNATARR
jgi:hypothetical protein